MLFRRFLFLIFQVGFLLLDTLYPKWNCCNYLLAVAEIEHANLHALRHTFATRAIENGVNVKALSDILGHATVQITMDLYCHSSLDLMRDSMNKIAGLF